MGGRSSARFTLIRKLATHRDQKMPSRRCLQTTGQRADIRRIAAATPADISDPFRPGHLSKLLELISGNLNGFQIIRKSRLPRETMAGIGGSKRGRLCGERRL